MKHFIKRFWPIVALVFIWFIFASPYFIKGLVPFPSKYLVTFFPPWSAEYGMALKNNAMPDVATQIYPWKKITIDSWKMGQIPLWNPYSFSGTPHAANYQSAVFSPTNLLYVVLPFLDAWSISVILQPLLAGLFMYLFLRSLERSQMAGLLGSIAFMFCGFITVWMAYGTLGWAVLWLPLLLLVSRKHFNKRSWAGPLIISAGLAWSFLSGHFQMSIYVLLALIVFIVCQMYRTKHIQAGIELGAGVLTGLMLAAPQILPSFDVYSRSVRSELFTQGGGIAWQYLVTAFAPDFYGNPVTRNDWYGFYAEWASYIGVVPLGLALYALFRRTKHIGFFLCLAIVSLLIATPNPVNTLIVWLKIPAVSTSYAARIIVLTSFALCVIAAYGLDGLRDDWEKKTIKSRYLFFLFVGLLLFALWGIIVFVKPFEADKLLIARRNLLFPSGLVFGFSILAIAGFISRWKIIRPMIMILLVLFTAGDMIRYAVKWMPFDPREYVYPQSDVLSFLQKYAGHDRIFGNLGGEVTNGYGLLGIEGYDAVYQRRYGEFIRSTSSGTVITPERSIVQFAKRATFSEQVLQLLGGRYMVHRLSDGRFSWAYPYWDYPYYKSIYRNNHYEVFENQKALPRAFLASSYVVRADNQSIVDTLFSDGFNLRETLVLEIDPKVHTQIGKGSVDFTTYSPNEVVIETSSESPKLLFLSDVFDPGWKATVDNNASMIYRADYDFRAVFVPAGKHTIRMVYQPESFVQGMWIALAGVGVMACVMLRMRTL